ncbi:serine hydrolase [Streptomyces sp. RFCAC02]|uniref:serine hydrolase n=1 Tax=Streptomyces sp. RFCAC02 TaxID=2499143 RepID=UPI001021E65A|nr:serine hydrolase [Streptomyces sp. RFCAC02]
MRRETPGPRRRFRPSAVVHTALATTLLAAGLTSDAVRSGVDALVGTADILDEAGGESGKDLERVDIPPSRGSTDEDGTAGARRDLRLAEAIAPLLDAPSAEGTRLSVAICALGSGQSAVYGSDLFDTASIVKVDILAALLLLAQDEGRELTAEEKSLAGVMIRQSDNDAADTLWRAIGGADGLDAANERLGLTRTAGGPEAHWGLTQTTSEDQLALLSAVYGTTSPLSAQSRAFVQDLMATVVDGQRWGVSAAADEAAFELKNGWLPRSQTGLWDINSIGRVTADGEQYLVAVVSDGHVTQAAGITAVEAAAEAAVGALTTDEGATTEPGSVV